MRLSSFRPCGGTSTESTAVSPVTTRNCRGVGPVRLLRAMMVAVQVVETAKGAVMVRPCGLVLALPPQVPAAALQTAT